MMLSHQLMSWRCYAYRWARKFPSSITVKRMIRSSPMPLGKETSQEIFIAPPLKARQVLAWMSAAMQLVFWGNLAQWAWTGYTVKDE